MIFWLMVQIAPNEYFLVAFDVVINSVCIMLMTAYYRDSIYYKRLCCCFLICCRSGVNVRSPRSQENTKRDATSEVTVVSNIRVKTKDGNPRQNPEIVPQFSASSNTTSGAVTP
mmetsp:Transcript_66787/g.106164  ORF Transcript_66787/g.106164 Transcript_66787/m.106164 type:complete len:114 (-) Transcript_66787:173-514(-)